MECKGNDIDGREFSLMKELPRYLSKSLLSIPSKTQLRKKLNPSFVLDSLAHFELGHLR